MYSESRLFIRCEEIRDSEGEPPAALLLDVDEIVAIGAGDKEGESYIWMSVPGLFYAVRGTAEEIWVRIQTACAQQEVTGE